MENNREQIMELKNKIIDKYKTGKYKTEYDISIVMTYYNRKDQTLRTLDGFQKYYANKYSFEVIIVDDNSNQENKLDECIKKYSFPINLIIISKEKKGDRINACVPYNTGFKKASGKIIIIQNPECYHIDNILNDTIYNLKKNEIVSYSCFGMPSFQENELVNNPDELKNKIKNITKIGGEDKSKNNLSVSGWLNEKVINPTYYHYCLSIHKSDLDILGGFSIDLRNGFCYDDDEFVRKAYFKNMKLNISELLVIHQFHEPSSLPVNIKQKMHFINFQIMKEKSKKMNISLTKQFKPNYDNFKQCIPKIAFSFWSGKDFSYINLLSIETFCFYNPSYKFILYTDLDITHRIDDFKEFTSDEHIRVNNDSNYFKYIKKLLKIYDIEIKVINKLEEKKCIIINTDYYRIYYLVKHGGIWVDLDILHLKSIDTLISDKHDIFVHKYEYGPVITTGIMGSIKNHPKMLIILDKIKELINNENKFTDYQAIGPSLFTEYRHLFMENEYIDANSFYPIEWYDIKEYYKDININIDFYGVHWYNGSGFTKVFLDEFEELFSKKKIINDKYCFFCKLIKKFYMDKCNKFSIDYVNFKFIPFAYLKNNTNFEKISYKNKTFDELAIMCENKNNYLAFDTYKNIYVKKDKDKIRINNNIKNDGTRCMDK
jgi:hypothetical protein